MNALRRSGAVPALAMLAAVVALNAALQPHFFSRASFESNMATFARNYSPPPGCLTIGGMARPA